jgi:hypothetical protein
LEGMSTSFLNCIEMQRPLLFHKLNPFCFKGRSFVMLGPFVERLNCIGCIVSSPFKWTFQK